MLDTRRFAFRLIVLAGALLVYLLLHGLWRLCRLPSPWPPRFLGVAARICGARVAVAGTPIRRHVVFLANHISWLDILTLAGATGSAFVAKAELRAAPVVGWLSTLNHTIFVSRADRMAIADQIASLRGALDRPWPVTIFPEGTTSAANDLLPFKGTLLAVLEPPPPGVMVQPVLIDYGDAGRAVEWLGEQTGQDNARGVLSRRGRFTVTLRFLDPFDPRDYPGRKGIAAEARRRIEGAMGSASIGAV